MISLSTIPRLARPLAVGFVGVAAAGAVAARDPHVPGSWLYCPTRTLLGCACPLCGGLSAVHDLAHADVARALTDNAFVVLVVLPVAVVSWALWFRRRLSPEDFARRQSERTLDQARRDSLRVRYVTWAVLLVGVVFTVVRNTPLGSALNPYF